jgi:hypothetical protein
VAPPAISGYSPQHQIVGHRIVLGKLHVIVVIGRRLRRERGQRLLEAGNAAVLFWTLSGALGSRERRSGKSLRIRFICLLDRERFPWEGASMPSSLGEG